MYHANGQRKSSDLTGSLLEALQTINAPLAIEYKNTSHEVCVDWEAEVKRNEFYHKYIQ